MTTTVALRLPWGRYHATPWDRNANEAAVEWPPSPWRILRAFYSTWKTRCPELTDDEVLPVLTRLSVPPRYSLPDFSIAHTRHYLPGTTHLEGRKTETTKTLDAFVVTARDAELFIEWPVDLSPDEQQVLGRLAEEISYLGRADAIVEGRIETIATQHREWLLPLDGPTAFETARVLAPELPLDVAALTRSPHQVRTDRRLVPPSARWIHYPMAVPSTPKIAPQLRSNPRVTAVRFAVTGRPPPPKYAAVALGDLARSTAMSKYGVQNGGAVSMALAGKDASGAKLSGPHAHAHYLSLTTDGRAVTTFVVWVPGGLDDRDLLAVATKMEFRTNDHEPGVSGRRLGVEAFGDIDDVAPELIGPAKVWKSHTPYAPTKHWKGDRDEQLLADITAELVHRNMPTPTAVEAISGDWLDYRRYRRKEGIGRARRSYGVRMTFAEPVSGPICLGQLSHYGLGLFLPAKA